MAQRTTKLRAALGGGTSGEARTAGGRRIAGTIGIGLGGRLAAIVVSLVTLPLIARTLGPSDFGIWTAALAYVGLFASFTEFGLGNAATQKMASDPEHESEWLSALSSLRTVFALVLVAVAALGVPFVLSAGNDLRTTSFILLITIFAGGASVLMSVFQTRLRPGIPVAISMLQSLIWLGTTVGLAIADAGPVGFAIGYSAMLSVIAVVQVQVTRRYARVAWRGVRERWRGLLEIAVPIGLGGVFVTVYYKVDAVLLVELSTPEEAGVYGAAYRFLDPLVFLPGTIMAALFPVVAAVHAHDPERVVRLVRRASEAMLLLSVAGFAIALALSDRIIDLFYGAEFARAAGLLPLLMASFIPICLGTLAGFIAPVLGLRWRITIYAAIGAFLNVGLNLLLIPKHGAYGSAWATLGTESLTMTLLLGTGLARLGAGLDVRRIVAVVVSGAAMYGAAYAARPLGLVPALVLGTITFVVAVLATRAVRPQEIRSLRRPDAG